MEGFVHEFRRALRALRRSPGFAASALLALAVGLGATVAIFTVLDAVVLHPLPYPHPDRLVAIGSRVPRLGADERWGVSPTGYFEYAAHARTLEAVGLYRTYLGTVTGGGAPARVQLALVSASLLNVLGARPAAGRLIDPADDRPGVETVVMLSHAFWKERYAADPRVVGSTLELDGERVRVAGVLERGVELPGQAAGTDLWVPQRLDPAAEPQNWHAFSAVARLRPGVSVQAARAEVASLTSRFGALFPTAYTPSFLASTGFRAEVTPLRDEVAGDAGRSLWVLFAAVAAVLLVACADVANLFLVRTEGRRRELAIRAAMGATTARLARELVAEGMVLGLLAGAVGTVLAWAGVRVMVAMAPWHLPRLEAIHLGWRGAAFALALSLAAGTAVGLFPLLRLHAGPGVLRQAARGATPGVRRSAAHTALVVGQVALALVLLSAAGLMLRTYARLRATSPGVDPRGVVSMDLTLPAARYPSFHASSAFYEELTDRVRALPGVREAGVGTQIPFGPGDTCNGAYLEDRAAAAEPECVISVTVSPGYFTALGMPLRGHAPSWNDVNRRSGQVVVTSALARRLWPGQDPIGKGLRGRTWGHPFYRVVGVAADVHSDGLDKAPLEAVFYPLLPMLDAPLWSPPHSVSLVVRADGSTEAVAAGIRSVVAQMDHDVPLSAAHTMDELMARSLARTTFTLLLLGLAAVTALALGAIGLYGVLTHTVNQRRAELAIRLALGAEGRQLAVLVLRHSVALALAGVAIGQLGSLATNRVLRSLLFETTPTDPAVLAGAAALLVVVAVAATLLPVRRAVRVDPMLSLRAD